MVFGNFLWMENLLTQGTTAGIYGLMFLNSCIFFWTTSRSSVWHIKQFLYFCILESRHLHTYNAWGQVPKLTEISLCVGSKTDGTTPFVKLLVRGPFHALFRADLIIGTDFGLLILLTIWKCSAVQLFETVPGKYSELEVFGKYHSLLEHGHEMPGSFCFPLVQTLLSTEFILHVSVMNWWFCLYLLE